MIRSHPFHTKIAHPCPCARKLIRFAKHVLPSLLIPLLLSPFPPSPTAQMAPTDADNRSDIKSESFAFPPDLVGPQERLPSGTIPAGSFHRNAFGFLIAEPSSGNGPPPAGRNVTIHYNGESSVNEGEWNNRVVERAVAITTSPEPTADATKSERGRVLQEACGRMQAGVEADPLFLPFLYNAAILSLLLKDPDLAIVYLRKARALAPQFHGSYLELGRAYGMQHRDTSALAMFREAARLNPLSPEPLVALGNVYLESRGYSLAEGYFRRALLLDGGNAEARIGLSRILMARGELWRARKLLREMEAASKRPDRADLHFYLGQIAEALGDPHGAIREYERSLALRNDPFFLKQDREALRQRLQVLTELVKAASEQLPN